MRAARVGISRQGQEYPVYCLPAEVLAELFQNRALAPLTRLAGAAIEEEALQILRSAFEERVEDRDHKEGE